MGTGPLRRAPSLNSTRELPHEQEDATFWFKGPRQGGFQKTCFVRILVVFMFNVLCHKSYKYYVPCTIYHMLHSIWVLAGSVLWALILCKYHDIQWVWEDSRLGVRVRGHGMAFRVYLFHWGYGHGHRYFWDLVL